MLNALMNDEPEPEERYRVARKQQRGSTASIGSFRAGVPNRGSMIAKQQSSDGESGFNQVRLFC